MGDLLFDVAVYRMHPIVFIVWNFGVIGKSSSYADGAMLVLA